MMAQAPQCSTCSGGSHPVDVVDSCDIKKQDLCAISYNMHGFMQGLPAIRDMMHSIKPVLMLQ